MIWRDRCSTAYDLVSLFRGRGSTLDRWSGKKTKQFCETSATFEMDNIKNEAILQDSARLPSKWKVGCRAASLVPIRLAICPPHLSKILSRTQNSKARSYKALHLSGKIMSANLEIRCSKTQPLSRNQRPNLLTFLMDMSCTAPATRHASLQSLAKGPTPPIVFGTATKPSGFADFDQVHNP